MNHQLSLDAVDFTPVPHRFTYKVGKTILRATLEIAPCVLELAKSGNKICVKAVSQAIVRNLKMAYTTQFGKSTISWSKIKWID